MHFGSSQCMHGHGVYSTRTLGTCPWSFCFTRIQNWPECGCGSA